MMKLIFSLALIVMANKEREKYKFKRVLKNYDYQGISSILLILETLKIRNSFIFVDVSTHITYLLKLFFKTPVSLVASSSSSPNRTTSL